MRVLALSLESYPSELPECYILMHQSMALEDLGHEVHVYNARRRAVRLLDYLQSFDFDIVVIDTELLRVEEVWRTFRQYRRNVPIKVAASLNRLPAPQEGPAWEVVDFVFTPWKGEAIENLARTRDVRYLPLGYNPRLHGRKTDLPTLGPVFVGNTLGQDREEAAAYLDDLRNERAVLCIGPAFEQKLMDPMMLGRVYAAARCLPNFHHRAEKESNVMLNERFWQTARCGIPVNDYSPLMREVWGETLLGDFSFADKPRWQERIRNLKSGAVAIGPEVLEQLDDSMTGHSYVDRMKQLLEWME